MKITYGIIPEDDFGYIYICESKNFHRCGESCQFVSYDPVMPTEIIKIYYRDFKDCFEYINKEGDKTK